MHDPELDPSDPYLADALTAFGRHLAKLRKLRRWSQERLALESGMARSYLSGIERGQRNLSMKNVIRLAHTLNIPLALLVNFKFDGLQTVGNEIRVPELGHQPNVIQPTPGSTDTKPVIYPLVHKASKLQGQDPQGNVDYTGTAEPPANLDTDTKE